MLILHFHLLCTFRMPLFIIPVKEENLFVTNVACRKLKCFVYFARTRTHTRKLTHIHARARKRGKREAKERLTGAYLICESERKARPRVDCVRTINADSNSEPLARECRLMAFHFRCKAGAEALRKSARAVRSS